MKREISACCVPVFFLLTACSAFAQQRVVLTEASTKTLDQSIAEITERRKSGDLQPIVLVLPAGTYRLNQTLQVSPETVGNGLTLRGDAKGETILNGAVKLRHLGRSDRQWRYALPEEIDLPTLPRILIVDAAARSAAKHPDVGYHRISKADDDRRSGFSFNAGTLPDSFDLAAGLCDLVFLHDWSASRLPVASINLETQMLRTVGPIGCSAGHYAIDHFEKHPRYWLEGHPSFADQPGEWYIDTESSEVRLLAGVETEPPVVELPVLETLLAAQGTDGLSIENLVLQNLVFTGSLFPMPEGGVAGAQATMHEPRNSAGERTTKGRPMLSAAVSIELAKACRVERCRFVGLGNTAMWFGSRTVDCEVADCVFEHIGGNGLNLGENNDRLIDGQLWYQSAPGDVPTNNRVSGCRIRHVGEWMPGSVAIWASLQRGLEIVDNEISDCPYTGISLGWIWNDTPSPASQNHILRNQIRHVMQVLSDGGGIYTLGRQPNSRIDSNVIANVPLNAGRAESNGIFMDQGTTGFVVEQNEFRRVAKSPLRFHKAGDNLVRNNRWELETDSTPEVRFNNTPAEKITLSENSVLAREPRIYLIGNSLTWDTRPELLDHYVDWHVDCGKSLQFIFDHPGEPCVASSRLWPIALAQLQYDFLSVQPHFGTTLEQDVEVISRWMRMQPKAILVLHSGWSRAATVETDFATTSAEKMTHCDAYFDSLQTILRERFPDRQIRRTDAYKRLHQIATDVKKGQAPLASLEDLYRDAIHMTQGEGRYLMHNRMRVTLGQPANEDAFDIGTRAPKLKQYLDRLIP